MAHHWRSRPEPSRPASWLSLAVLSAFWLVILWAFVMACEVAGSVISP